MKIKEISVSVGRTTSLGNFETFRNEIYLSASLGDKEEYDEQVQDLYQLAESELLESIKKASKKLSRSS